MYLQIIGKRLRIIGSTLRARSLHQKVDLVQEFRGFSIDRFSNGTFRPVIDKIFPLANAKEAHEYMSSKKNKGKILLTI